MSVTPLTFPEFVDTTDSEQRWQIYNAIASGGGGGTSQVNIQDTRGFALYSDNNGSLQVAAPSAIQSNIQDSQGNGLQSDGSGSLKVAVSNSVAVNLNAADGTGIYANEYNALNVNIIDNNGNAVFGVGGLYNSVSGVLNSLRTVSLITPKTFTATPTTTTVTASASILAASSTRTHLSISNTGSINVLYVNPTGGTASATLGIPIAPNTTYTFPANGIPSSSVTAFSITTTVFVAYA